jgi:hypothetical protein
LEPHYKWGILYDLDVQHTILGSHGKKKIEQVGMEDLGTSKFQVLCMVGSPKYNFDGGLSRKEGME